jgi:NodT family efflux transporter outer membrane factor (OMF) lipoprotein
MRRRRDPTLAALAGLCLISACAIGPDYRPPDGLTAAAWRGAEASGTAAAPAPDWWRGYADPVLDSLERAALAQNMDIAQAVARVKQARAAAGAANAAKLPAGQANASAAEAYQSIAGANAPLAAYFPRYDRAGSLFDVTAGASWELDVFGGLRRQSEAARAELGAAQASAAGARLMVTADVADAYIQLRAFQRRLQIAAEQTGKARQLLELVALRVDAGTAPRRDLDAARASAAEAEAVEPALRVGEEAEFNRLAVLTGATPEADRATLETPAALPVPPRIVVGRPGDLLRRRPDLIAAEQSLIAANARVGAAISDYYPKVDLQALAGFDSATAAALFSGGAAEAQGLLGLRWRLFDFGRVDAEVAGARGKTAEALAAYREAALRAAEDVENALTARVENQVRARKLHEEEVALTQARIATEDAYAAGQVSLLEVIDADRQLLATRDQALQADQDSARAAVALTRALGG